MTDVTDPLTYLRTTHAAAEADAEAAAERAWSPHWDYDDIVNEIRDLNNGNTLANVYFPEIGKHVEAHDPAAVLRRIAADRKILALHDMAHECSSTDWISREHDPCCWIPESENCDTLRALAGGWGWTEEGA